MKSLRKCMFILISAFFFLSACAGMETTKMVPDSMVRDLSPQFSAGKITSRVDGWVVLLDASSSMSHPYMGYEKFDIAKAFVKSMNDTLPPIPAASGLRTFGHAPELSSERTELFYGMSKFDRLKMKQGLSKVNLPGGPTPMDAAINAAVEDLQNISGNKAVIIVSDGEDLDDQPLFAAQKMLADLGDNLCIYTVLVGDDEKGKVLMEKIAKVSSCGFMVSALDTVPGNPMADYVSDVFLTSKGQGLGYHKAVSIMKPLSNIHFNFDNHSLTKQGKNILDQNIKILADNPEIKLTIEGHASARGADDYNLSLSKKRAHSVKEYMTSVGNISSKRLSIVGYGSTKPIIAESDPSQTDSPEAKKNMRVELKVIKY
ncbi:MAG: OmpA family protein [Pseudomonadota bacterium]